MTDIREVRNFFSKKYPKVYPHRSGGQGGVFRAIPADGGEAVAIKVMHQVSAKSILRFKREIATARRLRHENIIPIIDDNIEIYEKESHPFLYSVMPYAKYGSLAEHDFFVGERRTCLILFRRMMLGLHEFHMADPDNQLVHRDIKPGNVLFVLSETIPVIADFGLVGFAQAGGDGESPTETGERVGNRDFIAPEQFNDPAKAVQKSDIYSMGKVLYCMITGATRLLGSHGIDSVDDAKIDALIQLCTKDSPDERPTAKEAIEKIDQILNPVVVQKSSAQELDWVEKEVMRMVRPDPVSRVMQHMMKERGVGLREIIEHVSPLVYGSGGGALQGENGQARAVLEKVNGLLARGLLYFRHGRYFTEPSSLF
jgi:serine/threonine protein kinase